MTDAQPWHSLTEAAAMTGVDREALRSRARRGLIPSRKNNRGELLVQVPTDLLTAPDQDVTAVTTDRDRGLTERLTDRVTALTEAQTDLLTEIADLRTALARAETEVEAAKRIGVAEVEAARGYAQQLEALIVDLRRPWWRKLIG